MIALPRFASLATSIGLAAGAALAGHVVVGLLAEDPLLATRLEAWRPAFIAVAAGAGLACLLAAAACVFRPRGSAALALLVALPPGLLVAATLQLVALQPFHPTLAAFAGAMGAGTVAALFLAARAGRTPRARRLALRASSAILLGAVAGEAGLRVLGRLRPSPLLARDDVDARFLVESFRFRPGRIHNGFVCNSGGYFDDEFRPKQEGRFLAVAIGDSFSSGPVPHPLHFTTVAEKVLRNVEVHNLGVPGIGPREYLHLLAAEALPLRPDLVLISLFVGNDVEESGRALHRLPARWLDRGSFLLLAVPQRLAKLAGEGKPLERVGSPLGDGPAVSPWQLAGTYPFIADPMLEEPSFTADHFLWIETSRAKSVCGPDESRYPALFECLHRMREGSKAAGARFAVMLIPDEFQVEDAVWKDVVAATAPMPLERDKPQRLIGEWLAREGIAALDLLPALRGLSPLADGRRHAYHLRDTHFNTRGSEVAGRALAEFLRGLRP